MKRLIIKSTKISNQLITFRVSLFKLGNSKNGHNDQIKNTSQWCPSYLLKKDKKKDKGPNLEMISWL